MWSFCMDTLGLPHSMAAGFQECASEEYRASHLILHHLTLEIQESGLWQAEAGLVFLTVGMGEQSTAALFRVSMLKVRSLLLLFLKMVPCLEEEI